MTRRHRRSHRSRQPRVPGPFTYSVAVVNGGRAHVVRAAAALWALFLGLVVDVWCAVEVDEGDRGYSDHKLIRAAARAAGLHLDFGIFAKAREVILVAADIPVLRTARTRAGQAVAHWSPVRFVVARLVDVGPGVLQLVTHRAAGTGNQAKNRPAWARPLLWASVKTTDLVLARKIRRGLRKGYVVVVLLDANVHRYVEPRARGRADAVQLFADAPDFGYVYLPPDVELVHVDHQTHRNPIEAVHQVHELHLDLKVVAA